MIRMARSARAGKGAVIALDEFHDEAMVTSGSGLAGLEVLPE